MPYRMTTDQGTQFRSDFFKNIGVCGFKVCTTTSYPPECNGKIERIHRTLKVAIRVHNSVKWTQTLPTVLLGLRSALRSDTNYTPLHKWLTDKLSDYQENFSRNQKISWIQIRLRKNYRNKWISYNH
ncbi:transposon Ty3-I Gag-Pol polyprotein [Trichonephila clavipes]|nr:transposon Ty3-I Gag-Pol polyprotein [Trichonephila clavipes]